MKDNKFANGLLLFWPGFINLRTKTKLQRFDCERVCAYVTISQPICNTVQPICTFSAIQNACSSYMVKNEQF